MTDLVDRLLPCPFCGASPRWIADDSYGECMVFCPAEHQGCDAAPLISFASCFPQECVAAWNRRDGAADEIEKLRAQIVASENLCLAAANEIDRLRLALREIVAFDASHYAHDGNARILNIARAALEPTP